MRFPLALCLSVSLSVSASGSQDPPLPAADKPHPAEVLRNRERRQLLERLRSEKTPGPRLAEAERAAARSGADRVLIILVEFGGPDTFEFIPSGPNKSTWEPIGKADSSEWAGSVGDCSKIISKYNITGPTKYTYSGPLHNQIERPRSAADSSGDMIWREDFSPQYYQDLAFGQGARFQYKRQDGSEVNEDRTGYSVNNYYRDASGGVYQITGEVLGWLKLPHSVWWYGADPCPGLRSGSTSSQDAGAIPNAGSLSTMVADALEATKRAYPNLNWAQYDADKDGLIDRLWIICAGLSESESSTLLNRTTYGEAAFWASSVNLPVPIAVVPGVRAGPVLVMPENSALGVLAHEYGHSLGAEDLYARGRPESSVSFWSIMSSDRVGYPQSTQPSTLDPWHLDMFGWLSPKIITDPGKEYVVRLGRASNFPGGPGVLRGVKIPLPEETASVAVVPRGRHQWWSGQRDMTDARMTLTGPISIPSNPSGPVTLSFDTAYEIEEEWDFLWVQASTDGGVNWRTLTNAHTTCRHVADWAGPGRGFPNDICAAKIGGFTGKSAGYPGWVTESFDLGEFLGRQVWLRFWYMTDTALVLDGFFVDNIRVTAGNLTLFSDDGEGGDAKWRYSETFRRHDGTYRYTHNYFLQWRDVGPEGGFDRGLGNPRWRFGPANAGLLVWYNNNRYTNNDLDRYLFHPPSFGPKGLMLLVDAHPEPYRDPAKIARGYENEAANLNSQLQARDAPFSLVESASFAVQPTWVERETRFPGSPAVSRFSDSMGYYPGLELVTLGPKEPAGKKWITRMYDSSAVVPSAKPYPVKAPGYRAGEEVLYDCWPYTELGTLGCIARGQNLSLNAHGGAGDPSETGGQYGWNVQILHQTPAVATLHIWNDPAAKGPALGVAHAASYQPGVVSPGLLVTIFGTNLGPAALATLQLNAAGLVDTTLGGTRVLFDGVPAPLIYASSPQVSAIVPYSVAGKSETEIQVEYQGRLTRKLVLPVAGSAPGIFTADASGRGQGAILNQDGSVNSASNPAAPDSVVVIYLTGEGQTDPPGVDGKPALEVFPKPVLPVTVTIGGLPAEVLYAGAAPYMVAGVMQVNIRIPAGMTPGSAVPVVVKVGEAASQPSVTLALR